MQDGIPLQKASPSSENPSRKRVREESETTHRRDDVDIQRETDREETYLYGYDKHVRSETEKGKENVDHDAMMIDDQSSSPSSPHYLLLALSNGTLQIYRLDQREISFTCTLVFNAPRFSDGLLLIKNDSSDKIEDIDVRARGARTTTTLRVVEVSFHELGSRDTQPYLFALLNNGSLLIYQSFFYPSTSPDSIPMRLRRVGKISFTMGY
jgi:hypothetical protein